MRAERNDRRARDDEWDLGQFGALEQLGASSFDRFAVAHRAPRAPAKVDVRFDVCIELSPPPRLA